MEENQDLSAIVQDRVDRAVATSSEKLLTDLDALISTRIAGLQVELTQNQSSISSTQLEAINSIKNQHQPTFKRKGNQEQFQFNAKVNTALEEAKSTLESPLTEHSFLRAGSAIVQGMELIKHRQKLIRLADQSEAGWSMVSEYETNELADDSDDEKKITRADSRANRKLKESRVKRSRRQVRFDANSRTAYSAPVTSTRPGQQSTTYQTNSWPKRGLCFACGKPGHYRRECAAVAAAHNKISTGNILAKSIRTSSNLNGPPGNGSTCMYIGGGVSNSSNLPVDPFFGERICQEKIMPGNSSNVSPIGKLRQSYEMWQAASNNAHVLEIINSGYKLPFINTPPVSFCRNNKSALENADFVSSEIENLLGKGCITQVTNIPNVINPLTVACNKGGKLRLVLDCRIINLFLFKFGIKLDGIEVAEQIFQKGDYLFTFDLKSAYHHIEIFHTHRTYLGFAWKQGEETVYYVFNVLPFGLSTAAYIFTKLVRVMVAYWRGQGFRIAMYMDDGCGGSSTKNGALALSNTVQNSISKFGFLIAQDKCFWSPSNTVAWLGHVINTLEGSISVSETRILSLLESINEVVSSIATGVVSIDVRKLARIAGKIISMHTAIGPIVQLKSRYMYNCIETRHSWRGRVIVNTDVFSELLFWKENVRLLNGKVIWRDATCQNAMGQDDRFAMGQEDRFAMGHDGKFAMGHGGRFAMGQDGKCTTLDCGKFTTCQDNDFVMGQNGKCTTRADGKFALTAYSDASNTGYGGYVVDDMNSDVTGLWSFDEQALSSTWRELEAVARVMNANKDCISGHSVKWFTDNQNVARILHVGSQKLHLHDIAVSIYDSCQSLGTEIQAEWIPRELNGRADALSRGGDCDDWGISESAFLFIDHAFGPHSVDRFASEYNTKLPRFNSRWAFRNSEGIDAFAQSWKGENNWLVPPPRLVVSTLRLGLTERVNAALDTSDPDLLRLSRQLPAILVGSRSDNTSRKYWSYFVKWEHFVKDKGLLSALPGAGYWGVLNRRWRLCSEGRRQSPVNINLSALLYDSILNPITVRGHLINGTLVNSGNDVTLEVNGSSQFHATSGPLSYDYRLHHITFHFAQDKGGSEHRVDGVSFAAEMQLMFYNSDLYKNYTEAESSPYGLAAIAVFVLIRDKDHIAFHTVSSSLKSVFIKGQRAKVYNVDLRGILPNMSSYVTYEGSQTQPACHETVTWVVLNRPLYISQEQFTLLTSVNKGGSRNPQMVLEHNIRPIMPIHNRPIRTNIDFTKGCSMPKTEMYQVNRYHSHH